MSDENEPILTDLTFVNSRKIQNKKMCFAYKIQEMQKECIKHKT